MPADREPAPCPLSELSARDLTRAGVVFAHDGATYCTTGEFLAKGGMGELYALERRCHDGGDSDDDAGSRDGHGAVTRRRGVSEPAVAKVFQAEYLVQIRTDEVTRRDHERNLAALDRIARLQHGSLLPMHLSVPIADNHLTVSPRQGGTLLELVAQGQVPTRTRVERLLQALRGLAALHGAGLIHRDFTLRNMLVSPDRERAFLFDYDLALALDDVAGHTYKQHYRGRIFGSPGYSVAPEILHAELMERPISPHIDIYAVGGSLFGLFSEHLPYGETEDMWGLLLRISDGVVFAGESLIAYPSAVPRPLRPIINRCMEHDPALRYATIGEVVTAIEDALPELANLAVPPVSFSNTLRYGAGVADARGRLQQVFRTRRDDSVSIRALEITDAALARQGYQIQRSLGRVKGHPIYVAAPVPLLLAAGQFPDANTYPKMVTSVDLGGIDDAERFLDLWLGGYLPILRRVRQGLMTSLFRAVHDADSRQLLLFSEYVDDARFGTDLGAHELALEEALGLAYLCTMQVRRLHRAGLAHNNIHPGSLLLKGVRDGQRCVPAMIGLVDPSFAKEARAHDVAALVGMILGWLSPARIAAASTEVRKQLEGLRRRLDSIDAGAEPVPASRELVKILIRGLTTVDPNFGVLAEHGGDLTQQALLLTQHRLYARLWRPG
jgi:tRNA A-37 threonylcarbamoyl transferase component Bud32